MNTASRDELSRDASNFDDIILGVGLAALLAAAIAL
jgi:hypothetical protein